MARKFKRQNRAVDKRVGEAWRKPRGIDNKQRIQLRSTGALPRIGYRTACKVRGLHPSGCREKLVFTTKDLEKGFAVRLGGTLGKRKRSAIIAEAKKMGLKVLN